MSAHYDFDIHWVFPRDLGIDPAIGRMLGEIGVNMNARGNYIALFRDPAVIATIERADPVLREYLKASGFGFVPSGSGLPQGYAPGEDEGARNDVLARLEENLSRFDLAGADLGGFDFAALVRAITRARPGMQTPAGHDASGFATGRHRRGAVAAGPMLRVRPRALVVNLVGLALLIYVALKLLALAAPL